MLLCVPYLIPDLEQIVFDYIIDINFICENNDAVTRYILRQYIYDIDNTDWKRISIYSTRNTHLIQISKDWSPYEIFRKGKYVKKYMHNISEYSPRCRSLSESFIREFADKVDWFNISRYQKLSESFIREFADRVNWKAICQYQKLSESFIRKFADKVNWFTLSRYQKLSELFIEDFRSKVKWNKITRYQKLSEPFIERLSDGRLCDSWHWWDISRYQKLSEAFIRKYHNDVWWGDISRYQKLSESFIIEFTDEVLWFTIFEHQKISKEFKLKFNHKCERYSSLFNTIAIHDHLFDY